MYFGQYSNYDPTKTSTYNFYGLNRTRRTSKGEFSDMKNMSTHEYPCATPRKPRRCVCGPSEDIIEITEGINAVCAPDATNTDAITGITGMCDGGFYYNGKLKSGKFILSPEWSWLIEQKGNTYIINGYDAANKKSLMYYYNIDTDEFEEGGTVMRNLIVQSYGNCLVTPADDGNGIFQYQCTLPDGTVIKNSDFWNTYRDYVTDDTEGNWTLNSTDNIFQQYFKIGDEITIVGFPGSSNGGQIWNIQSSKVFPQPGIDAKRNNTIDIENMITTNSVDKYAICTAKVTSFEIKTTSRGRAYHRIYFTLLNKNGETVSFKDMLTNGLYCSGVTLKRRTKVFDNITIHHGRVWGSVPSGNQIYASASDDIFSFSSDDIVNKYAVRIPSDTPGTFTALCSYNNDLVAFKPDSITVISGTNPVNYSSFVIGGIGCISPKSVAVTPEGVIFLSYNGFYIYNGALPQCISTKVNTKYISATSGYDGTSYYASTVTENGECELLVYNMNYGMWHKRDNIPAKGFFRFLNVFYVADELSLYKTDSLTPQNWSFTLMSAHDNRLDIKGINEIWVRAEIADGANFVIETSVDGGEFKTHSGFSEPGLKVYRCPVRLEMGENYTVRISGTGKVVVYEVEIRKADGGRRHKEY